MFREIKRGLELDVLRRGGGLVVREDESVEKNYFWKKGLGVNYVFKKNLLGNVV